MLPVFRKSFRGSDKIFRGKSKSTACDLLRRKVGSTSDARGYCRILVAQQYCISGVRFPREVVVIFFFSEVV